MGQKNSSLEKPVLQQSKKERVAGVRPLKHDGTPKSGPLLGGIKIEESITIDRPLEEIYAFWRDFTNLPRFCKYLKNVTVIDDEKSRWTVDGPAGKELTWEAVIIEDRPEELLSWRALEDSEFMNAGSVRFEEAPDDRGTIVRLTFAYNPPAGPLGSLIAKLAAKDPAFLLKDELRRLKQLLETGEIPTTAGQSAPIDK